MARVRVANDGGFGVGLALAVFAAGAWALLLAGGHEMRMSATPFLVGWTVMMAAMMLPSIAPLAIVYHRSSRDPAATVALTTRRCQTPFDFIMWRWRRGRRGAVRLGLDHGLYCVGCCWGLMAVLIGAAAMSLAGAAVIALIVFVEKALPRGIGVARVLGVLAVAGGVAYAIGS